MIRLRLSLDLDYEVYDPGCDFIFNIHAAHTGRQRVLEESLWLSQPLTYQIDTDLGTHNRYLRMHAAPGHLQVSYKATVELAHFSAQPNGIEEIQVPGLPTSVLGYIYPSRYCQSDLLYRLARREFSALPQGYSRVQAIRDWVVQRTSFTQNTTNANTSAIDTLLETVGVCRDFSHLMIALCRALNIPARFATGIDYGADPVLGPTDFHAYVEAYLGNRWYIFDASGTCIPMGFVRFGTGRDAADVAFATIFGPVQAGSPRIAIEVLPNSDGQLVMPQHTDLALSTDDL
jgi:transglutaminase-like putative cysteine protease